MKKSELRKMVRQVLKQEIYHRRQLQMAQRGHDWQYNMTMKVKGAQNQSKWLSIDQKTFNQIKDILSRM